MNQRHQPRVKTLAIAFLEWVGERIKVYYDLRKNEIEWKKNTDTNSFVIAMAIHHDRVSWALVMAMRSDLPTSPQSPWLRLSNCWDYLRLVTLRIWPDFMLRLCSMDWWIAYATWYYGRRMRGKFGFKLLFVSSYLPSSEIFFGYNRGVVFMIVRKEWKEAKDTFFAFDVVGLVID